MLVGGSSACCSLGERVLTIVLPKLKWLNTSFEVDRHCGRTKDRSMTHLCGAPKVDSLLSIFFNFKFQFQNPLSIFRHRSTFSLSADAHVFHVTRNNIRYQSTSTDRAPPSILISISTMPSPLAPPYCVGKGEGTNGSGIINKKSIPTCHSSLYLPFFNYLPQAFFVCIFGGGGG
jgi:hypothetical protein